VNEGESKEMELYHAMIWIGDRPGERVTIVAESLEDAREKLEAKYGKGTVFYLRNKEDEARPR
jgi:hypothetical protein